MRIETIKIANLIPYSKNARVHPQKQIDLLARNIEKYGFTTPVLIDEKNNVIAGHGRLLALKQLKREDVPCVRIEGLSEEDISVLRLADNQIAAMGDFNMQLVIEELQLLSPEMLDLTGFSADLLITSDEADDVVPDVPIEAQSKLGDLYELGKHRVLCGDSTKREDVEKLMGGKKADMVFTDPPYGMNLDTDYSSMSKDSKKHDKIIGDDNPYDPSVIFDLFGYCKEILLFGADYYVDRLPNFGRDGSWIVWDKRVEEKYDKVIGSSYEMLWMKQKHRREILRYNYVSWQARMADGKKTHPTMKPVGLLSQVILKTIDDGKLIVDLFLGSGSTLIACEKTGRVCFGCEISPAYCDVIISRYCQYVGNYNIIKNGKAIIWKTKQNL